MRHRLIFDGHDSWLKARNEGIGASEVASVLGLNPWETPYQLWRKKLGLDAPVEENEAMKRGHILEDAVAQYWQDATGNKVIKSSQQDFMFYNPEKPYLRVSPDRTYWLENKTHNDNNKGILECKTTMMDIDPDNIPLHWFCQVQMNLGVAHYQHGSLAWLTNGWHFGYKDIEFDQDYFEWMIEQVDQFWVDNIIGKKEPLATTVDDTLLKFPRHSEGKRVEATSDLVAKCTELKELKGQLSELDSRKKEIESEIKMAIGDAEALVTPIDNSIIASWKSAKNSTKFNEKLFAQENPDAYAKYQYEVQGSRRFLIK